MPGRKFSAGTTYRYGFNGKENDNDVKGEGNQQDYGMRIYDPRLGKFLSVDPLTKQYPDLTPYQFASNTPNQAIDLDGLEAVYHNARTDATETGPLNPKNYPTSAGWKCETCVPGVPEFVKRAAPINLVLPDHKDEQIATADIFGNGHIGPRAIVEENVAAIRQNYYDAVGDNIRGGPFGAASYIVGGDKASFYGAVADNIALSFAGIPEESSVLSRPQNLATLRYIPAIEEVNSKAQVTISIDANRHPEAALHAQEAMAKGVSGSGVLDRKGADARRAAALRGIKTEIGKDRDEFPPAVINNRGNGSSVKLIDRSDNRGAGSMIGQQIRNLPDNTSVVIKIVSKTIK